MSTSTQSESPANANISTATHSQDYIDELETRLDKAEKVLDLEKVQEQNAQKNYDTALSWFEQVKKYKTNIDKTDKLANEVIKNLKLAEEQAILVGTNAALNVQGVKILIVKVKEVAASSEELKSLMKNFLDKLDCITDPGLQKTVSIMLLVDNLKTAIDLAVTAALEAIANVMELLKYANQIQAHINNSNGLKANFTDMDNTLKTGEEQHLKDPSLEKLGEMLPSFPLTDCDGDYYDKLKAAYTSAHNEIEENNKPNALASLVAAKAEKNTAQSKHDAIKTAFEAATAAKTC